jgi:hypothetical protein
LKAVGIFSSSRQKIKPGIPQALGNIYHRVILKVLSQPLVSMSFPLLIFGQLYLRLLP